jgi:hypothetical protein
MPCMYAGSKRRQTPTTIVTGLQRRVARWHIFKPKIPILVNFGGYCNGSCWFDFMAIWSTVGSFGIFYGHLVYFMSIWYILWSFGTFCGNLVNFPKKNLATLLQRAKCLRQSQACWRSRRRLADQVLTSCWAGALSCGWERRRWGRSCCCPHASQCTTCRLKKCNLHYHWAKLYHRTGLPPPLQ